MYIKYMKRTVQYVQCTVYSVQYSKYTNHCSCRKTTLFLSISLLPTHCSSHELSSWHKRDISNFTSQTRSCHNHDHLTLTFESWKGGEEAMKMVFMVVQHVYAYHRLYLCLQLCMSSCLNSDELIIMNIGHIRAYMASNAILQQILYWKKKRTGPYTLPLSRARMGRSKTTKKR